MLGQDPFLRSEIAEKFNSAQQTISGYIWKIGFVWKYSRWMPPDMSQKNLDDLVVLCTSLLTRIKVDLFLNRMRTGGENWVTQENIVSKRAYCEPRKLNPSISKQHFNLNKRMLCIWWGIQGPKHYQLLPNETGFGISKSIIWFCFFYRMGQNRYKAIPNMFLTYIS